jgi:isoamylase
MSENDWNADFARAVGVFLNGDAIPTRDMRGRPTVDDSFLLLFNADPEPIDWSLPEIWPGPWKRALDTANPDAEPSTSETRVTTAGRSVVVPRRPRRLWSFEGPGSHVDKIPRPSVSDSAPHQLTWNWSYR